MHVQILTDPTGAEAGAPNASTATKSACGSSGARARGSRGPRCDRNVASGFTLVELMIVVLVIGILAAIAIPNFMEMQKRATEGTVKSNMHTLQMSIEDFALLNDGNYPTSAASTLPDGRPLNQVCPLGDYPTNPYTRLPSTVRWNADPSAGSKGELALNPALSSNYLLKGNGADGQRLPLTLTSGQ